MCARTRAHTRTALTGPGPALGDNFIPGPLQPHSRAIIHPSTPGVPDSGRSRCWPHPRAPGVGLTQASVLLPWSRSSSIPGVRVTPLQSLCPGPLCPARPLERVWEPQAVQGSPSRQDLPESLGPGPRARGSSPRQGSHRESSGSCGPCQWASRPAKTPPGTPWP